MKYYSSVVLLLSFLTACMSSSTGSSDNRGQGLSTAINLNWSQSFELEDGTALDPAEIESYIIHWRHSTSDQYEEIIIDDTSINSYVFTATKSGEYYFTLSLKTVYGTNSQLSNVVYKEVK